MTLNIDTSAPIRSLVRQRELIKAIYEAPKSTQETDWVEWKSDVDLGEKRWQAQISKHIGGMANRDPDVAAKWAKGCGLVVLGVEPGRLCGTTVYDNATIEPWLTGYVGGSPRGPQWASAYVEFQGQQVLIITIEPPQIGDPIWPLLKGYTANVKKGEDKSSPVRATVYVRHQGRTEEAKPADYEMLSRRAAGRGRRLGGLELLLIDRSRAAAVDTRPETIAAWAGRERASLEPPPPPPAAKNVVRVNPGDPGGAILEALTKAPGPMMGAQLAGLMRRDERTRAEYDAEVERYIKKATKAMPAFLISRTCERGFGRIALSVHNPSDEPIQGLRIELAISAQGMLAIRQGQVGHAKLPKRPIMLGKATTPLLGGGIRHGISLSGLDRVRIGAIESIGPHVEIDNGNSTYVTFPAFDLYAQATVPLDEFFLWTHVDHAGNPLVAEWSGRARSLGGVVRGSLEIAVDPSVPTIEELMEEPEPPTEPDDDEEEGDEDD